MTPFASEWVAHQRARFLRHDAHRFLRHDWERFVKPGAAIPWPLSAFVEAKAGFDPNQPRVPAGNPGGGRWTSGASAGGRVHIDLQNDDTDLGGGASDGEDEDDGSEQDRRYEVFTDETGEESWSSYANGYRPDGSLAEEAVINRDGSRITSEYSAAGDGHTWDERHTVTLPDGSRTVFERSGDTQTVYDGEGNQISKSTWTDAGPEPDAAAQQVFLGPALGVGARVAKGVEAGLTLFTWLSTRNGPDSAAVFAFNAHDFRNEGTPETPSVIWAGKLNREEVQATCKQLKTMQDFTDKAFEQVKESNDYRGPADFGSKVHKKIADSVRNERDPFFRAEFSLFKSLEAYKNQQLPKLTDDGMVYPNENYGKLDTYRMDALEYRPEIETTCVYDPKTGKEGFRRGRMSELALTIYRVFPNTKRSIMIEVRPSNQK
jgi:hypothetical protein